MSQPDKQPHNTPDEQELLRLLSTLAPPAVEFDLGHFRAGVLARLTQRQADYRRFAWIRRALRTLWEAVEMPRGREHPRLNFVEFSVVIIVLGLMAALVMPRVVGETDRARYEQAKVQMRILSDALRHYRLDNGSYPSTEQGLAALVRRPSVGVLPRSWREGGYLDTPELPTDPWGNPYLYSAPGQHSPEYDLKSLGADGLEGGAGYNADLESWRLP
jgi:general secretion pathway protein G